MDPPAKATPGSPACRCMRQIEAAGVLDGGEVVRLGDRLVANSVLASRSVTAVLSLAGALW